LALVAIIQVSDQPVEPSSGQDGFDRLVLACSRFAMNCHDVRRDVPAVYDATWSL
jgi:hypothetical protein